MPKSLVLFAVVSVLTVGCAATDDRPAVWEYISPALFQPNCATSSCHSRAAAVAGLDFSDPERGYTSLTALWVWIVDPNGTAAAGCRPLDGTIVCQRPGRALVTPFDPQQSRIVNMLRAQNAPRMPPDRPFAEADIALVEKWILNGAMRSVNGAAPSDAGTGSDAAADRNGDAGGVDGPSNDAADAPSDGSNPDGGATDGKADAAGDSSVAIDGRDA